MSPNNNKSSTAIPPVDMYDYWMEEIEINHRSKHGLRSSRIAYTVPNDSSFAPFYGRGRKDPPMVPGDVLTDIGSQVAKYLQQWHDMQRYGPRQTNSFGNVTTTASNYNTTNQWTTTTAASTTYNHWVDYQLDQPPLAQRRKPPLEFNKYINASDMLEEFLKFLGEEGVKQDEAFQLPVDLFIKWLVVRACEADQEEPPEDVVLEIPKALPAPKSAQPRCLGCQRFMSKGVDIPFHGPHCAVKYYERQGMDLQVVVKGPPILVAS